MYKPCILLKPSSPKHACRISLLHSPPIPKYLDRQPHRILFSHDSKPRKEKKMTATEQRQRRQQQQNLVRFYASLERNPDCEEDYKLSKAHLDTTQPQRPTRAPLSPSDSLLAAPTHPFKSLSNLLIKNLRIYIPHSRTASSFAG